MRAAPFFTQRQTHHSGSRRIRLGETIGSEHKHIHHADGTIENDDANDAEDVGDGQIATRIADFPGNKTGIGPPTVTTKALERRQRPERREGWRRKKLDQNQSEKSKSAKR